MTKNDITAGCSRCGGVEFIRKQINDRQRLRKEENADIEETGWRERLGSLLVRRRLEERAGI